MDAANPRQRFETQLLPHLDAAHNLARWLCGNDEDASVVVQEALARACPLFGSARAAQPRPWLLAIVHATWQSRYPAPRHADNAWAPDTPDDATQWLLRDEDIPLVNAALERLPVACREVLVLRELEGLHYHDIARIVDIPVDQVASRLDHGRRLLAATVALIRNIPPVGESRHGLH
ncbi:MULTISPECIES: sigma-70 family RNA polymerase sigma factor [unclassified Cupriavidus]|uniref:sigma-70 family RNA polymerase sigma factor n=1 Tax=unclassified Cupriavidus TaxID=2640874 RepID=UPI0010F94A49|nr:MULTISPECIES: sigma-70 family RNA polymerase sigma factor [unclassified Cupriavidus]MWL86431.1 sigma-70 family RNA polymerase sigma factor [Cupriavidus sp. SW-Y-13]